MLTLGRYGSTEDCISLKKARDELDKAKDRHREGECPRQALDLTRFRGHFIVTKKVFRSATCRLVPARQIRKR